MVPTEESLKVGRIIYITEGLMVLYVPLTTFSIIISELTL